MPRVHRRKAAKDYPAKGIKKGDLYYTWKVKTGPRSGITYRQLTPPRRSQLTMSEFQGQLYDLQDELEAATTPDEVRDIASRIRDLGEEQQAKLDNMPEGLQQGDTGQLLEERASGCESWADELESAMDQLDDEPDEDDPDDENAESLHEQWVEAFNDARDGAAGACPF